MLFRREKHHPLTTFNKFNYRKIKYWHFNSIKLDLTLYNMFRDSCDIMQKRNQPTKRHIQGLEQIIPLHLGVLLRLGATDSNHY